MGVMGKMDAIERQIEAEEEEEEARKRQADTQLKKGSKNEFEDSGDGIITGRKSKSLSRQKQTNEDDLLFAETTTLGEMYLMSLATTVPKRPMVTLPVMEIATPRYSNHRPPPRA